MKRIDFALLTAAMAVATAKADNITFADANVKAQAAKHAAFPPVTL